ncbi:Uncharacterised protein (plasmid) [Raoultella terrigena]|uniref:Uncharacterized protein n=1 Tax=Raoultella terrigena TaxID=577 RepID=A0A7Z8Z642_RAOTE|nr:Uncharacterised protein [Raoultella terrigena]
MCDVEKLSISYIELKEITEKRLLNRLKMKEQAEQPYDYAKFGNDSNLLIVFYVQIMPDDLVMQLHRF